MRQIAQERKESGMTEDDETFGTMKDERWPMLKDQQLNLIATNLFHHTVRYDIGINCSLWIVPTCIDL